MAWVRGIREVRHVIMAADGDAVGMKRGPVMTKQTRVISDLPPEAWARLVGFRVSLPLAAGAGPCGTCARMTWPAAPHAQALLPLAWSIRHLVEPLRAYYAAYVRPMHFGPKTGPRGRRAA